MTEHQRLERHIERLPESGCWIWMGCFDKDGYGRIRKKYSKSLIRAHRWSWELFNGKIPHGLWVLHKCDTPSCVNPYHLFLGTHTDNMRDCAKKKRFNQVGSNNRATHLTDEDIIKIREDKRMYKFIGKDYNLAVSTICCIKKRRNWGHI